MEPGWSLRAALVVAVGAALGGLLRYAAMVAFPRATFPWATLGVNVLGSFLLGALLFAAAARPATFGETTRLFLGMGVLGGFTTMSAFAGETVVLVEAGAALRAAAYVGSTMVGCVGAAAAGGALTRALL